MTNLPKCHIKYNIIQFNWFSIIMTPTQLEILTKDTNVLQIRHAKKYKENRVFLVGHWCPSSGLRAVMGVNNLLRFTETYVIHTLQPRCVCVSSVTLSYAHRMCFYTKFTFRAQFYLLCVDQRQLFANLVFGESEQSPEAHYGSTVFFDGAGE